MNTTRMNYDESGYPVTPMTVPVPARKERPRTTTKALKLTYPIWDINPLVYTGAGAELYGRRF